MSTVAFILARTARRKAAGANQTYPEHAGKVPVADFGACAHRQPHRPGDEVSCRTCAGRVALKVFGCAVHGTCTVGKKVTGHACCAGCPDRT